MRGAQGVSPKPLSHRVACAAGVALGEVWTYLGIRRGERGQDLWMWAAFSVRGLCVSGGAQGWAALAQPARLMRWERLPNAQIARRAENAEYGG